MRLIDANALAMHMADWQLSASSDQYSTIEEAIDAVTSAPTIDAVPVVRCMDCKWFCKMGCAIEVVDETDMPKENDFCSMAERKDNDYIKRDDTLKAMGTWDKFGCDGHGRLVPYTEEYVPYVKFDDMTKAVEGQPPADVAPVWHGRWVVDEIQNHVEKTYHCSKCDYQAWGENEKTRYCPNCGASMDGDADD